MFSKLLKYELKSVGKWYFALNASVIAISFFLGFSIKSLETYAQTRSEISSTHFTQLIPIILSLIFGILVAGAWIATFVIIIRRFYKKRLWARRVSDTNITCFISSTYLIKTPCFSYMDCVQCNYFSNWNYISHFTNLWCRKIFNGSSLLCISFYTN